MTVSQGEYFIEIIIAFNTHTHTRFSLAFAIFTRVHKCTYVYVCTSMYFAIGSECVLCVWFVAVRRNLFDISLVIEILTI